MIDLSSADSPRGERPKRVEPKAERVLHLHLWTSVEGQQSLCDALAALGPYRRLDWTRVDREVLPEQLRAAVREHRPTLLWMQLQTDGVVTGALLDELRALSPGLRIVSWCGDVGRNPAWSHRIAPHVDALFFSSTTQAEQHRAAGFPNAAYLQIGYDTETHYPPLHGVDRSGTVFFGQRFDLSGWPYLPEHEIQLRTETIRALGAAFGLGFAAYGSGWEGYAWGHPPLFPALSAERYRRARCAVSVSITSRLGRYSSDRLFRALACGPVVLVKRFDDMEALGLADGGNCLVWDSPDDCVELVRFADGLADEERARIGWAGAMLARSQHTWLDRMHEMAAYLELIDACA